LDDYLKLILWVLIIGGIFAFLWYKGHLRRVAGYTQETQQELKKCAWPTWEELRGSTWVVSVAIILLAVFTVVVDLVLSYVISKML